MDNLYFKTLFNKFSGFVYQFADQIPDGEDAKSYIVDEFVAAATRNGLELTIIQLVNTNFVVHSYHDLESEKFIKLYNLSEEPPVIIDTSPEPISEGEE